jgi:ABC-type multidrug transport system permease subunit
MLRDALFLTRKDTRLMFRGRETWLWVFVMPVVFFYFIGTVIGGFSRSGTDRPVIALEAPPDGGFLADILAGRLEERGYRVVRPAAGEDAKRYTRRLSLPAGFTDNVLSGKPMKVRLTRSGGGLGANYDEVRAGRAVYSLLADLIVADGEGGKITRQAMEDLARRPRLVTMEVTSAGRHVEPPSGFMQAVPGITVMFVLMTMLTTGATWLIIERKQGILRRLASSPMTRGAIVAGKWGTRMVLGSMQIVFAMLAGSVLFRVQWGPHLWAVLLVLVTYAALAVALSILVGSLARTEAQAIGISVITTNILAALGGCWWPIEITPRWAQSVAMFLPTGWAMDAMHKLVSFGDPPSVVVPHLTALTASALLASYLAARRFRFQ